MRAKIFITCLGLAVAAWLMAPTTASAQANHYACYQVKDLKVPAKLVKGQSGTHSDQVNTAPFEKCKLKYLCTPTSKNGGPVPDPSLHYLCHQCKGLKVPVAFDVTDQYISGRVETKKLRLICNPAQKTPA
jgi:hypothetical protein